MAEQYVVDMRHFVDIRWDEVRDPAPLRRIVDYFASVVEAGTASPRGGVPWTSALVCPRRPGRRPCKGRFVLVRQEVPPRIDWECPRCGERGTVTGWRGTTWDLGGVRSEGGPPRAIVLPAAEYAAFFREVLLADDLRCFLRAGEGQEDGSVLLSAGADDLDLLLDEASAVANHCESRARRRLLERAVERIEEVARAR